MPRLYAMAWYSVVVVVIVVAAAAAAVAGAVVAVGAGAAITIATTGQLKQQRTDLTIWVRWAREGSGEGRTLY
ncbi:unnamed protein product [Brugia pahangi]|uniref:Secreted protein n=1 Tax=Brugia pahangi TaxID=6280 RepID=A0A0N4TJF3_BRUPA|nr:unnamed protein product [Brugia pahangi]